jgi:Arc/MetJ-type ribon-helix-helix transcriptional regulator
VTDASRIFESIRAALREKGINLDASCCVECDEGAKIKVVCMPSDLKESVECVTAGSRDQVVMVRVDAATSKALDAWVESGAVKSRSEAAAVFINEGLKLREAELAQLREALDAVEAAKSKLRDRAKEVFGPDN